jgi:tetratricopeptide (TPR) repeat protein
MSSFRQSAALQNAVVVLAFLLGQLFLPIPSVAQGGASETVGSLSSSGQVIVMVRDSAGEPLRTPALVRLFSADGMPVGQVPVVRGGEATFRGVHQGSYSVEVEASGYANAHGNATLPMTGEVHVEIYLRPESNAEPIVLTDTGVPVLAPKAKKEMDDGLEALRKKDFAEAQKHLEKAKEMAPMHPDVLYLLGSLSARMNDLPRAEELLGKATQMEPQHAHAQAALGVVLVNERKFDAALSPLGKALELDEKSWEARWALARCYYNQRKFQPALEESRRALQDSNGQAPEIALVAAASLTALGQYENSAAMLREFLQRYPDQAGAVRARRWLERLQVEGKIKPN